MIPFTIAFWSFLLGYLAATITKRRRPVDKRDPYTPRFPLARRRDNRDKTWDRPGVDILSEHG